MKFSEGHGWVQGQKISAGPEENCSWNCGLCVFHLSEAKAAFSSVFCDAVTTPESCVREGREKPSLKSQPKTWANIAELQLPLCRGWRSPWCWLWGGEGSCSLTEGAQRFWHPAWTRFLPHGFLRAVWTTGSQVPFLFKEGPSLKSVFCTCCAAKLCHLFSCFSCLLTLFVLSPDGGMCFKVWGEKYL